MALLRAGVTNEAAAERMRQLFASQLGPVISKLSVSDPATRAGLVATQTLGFALCRYVLVLPPVAALSRDEIIAWLGPTIDRYLTGDLAAGRTATHT